MPLLIPHTSICTFNDMLRVSGNDPIQVDSHSEEDPSSTEDDISEEEEEEEGVDERKEL